MFAFLRKAILAASLIVVVIAYLLIRQSSEYVKPVSREIISDKPSTHEAEKTIKKMGYITVIRENARVMVGRNVVSYASKGLQFKVLDYRHGWYLIGYRIGNRSRRGWIKDSYVTWHIQDREGPGAFEEGEDEFY